MTNCESNYFDKLSFTKAQVQKYLENSTRDLNIAKKVNILEVKFTYTYSSFLKARIALLGSHGIRVRSVPGHQVKIIQKMGELLKVPGGIEVTETECRSYIKFVDRVVGEVRKAIEAAC